MSMDDTALLLSSELKYLSRKTLNWELNRAVQFTELNMWKIKMSMICDHGKQEQVIREVHEVVSEFIDTLEGIVANLDKSGRYMFKAVTSTCLTETG